ncbi:MAG: fluoride efflux transporter CrcB [Ferruginibacter sp.]|nr:fluoride efflux transporter CrcB [Ferruginibacter sp.]
MIKSFLLVGLGGAIGAMCRYIISVIWKTNSFPFPTLVINIVGSLVIGIVIALSEKNNLISDHLKLFLATGICGGFTTFSTFSVENMLLIKAGNYLMAAVYIFTSIVACILATFVGFKIINN